MELSTASFGNERLFTQKRETFSLIKCFGPMYIDFDEYPRYSGGNSEIFEKYVNANIKCEHRYSYSSGKYNVCSLVNKDTW